MAEAKAKPKKQLAYEQVLTLVEVSVIMLTSKPGDDIARSKLVGEFREMLPPNTSYRDEDFDRAVNETCVCVDKGPSGGATYRMRR